MSAARQPGAAVDVSCILLTRYNVADPKLPAAAMTRGLDDAWLAGRLSLFSRYCAPSVDAIGTGFVWFVFVRSDTPEPHLATIRARLPIGAELVPVPPGQDVTAYAQRAVSTRIARHHTHVLTARLDTDDAISRAYLATMRDAARRVAKKARQPVLINPSRGIVVIERDRLAVSVRHTSSPFLGLLEPAEEFETVWTHGHSSFPSSVPIVHLRKRMLWMQVVHEDNLSNRARAGVPLSPRTVERAFDVDREQIRNVVACPNSREALRLITRALGHWMRRRLHGFPR